MAPDSCPGLAGDETRSDPISLMFRMGDRRLQLGLTLSQNGDGRGLGGISAALPAVAQFIDDPIDVPQRGQSSHIHVGLF